MIEYAVTRSRDVRRAATLEQEVLESSEHERQRIARELDAELGQQLTGIAIMARALATARSAALPEAGDVRQLGDS